MMLANSRSCALLYSRTQPKEGRQTHLLHLEQLRTLPVDLVRIEPSTQLADDEAASPFEQRAIGTEEGEEVSHESAEGGIVGLARDV